MNGERKKEKHKREKEGRKDTRWKKEKTDE